MLALRQGSYVHLLGSPDRLPQPACRRERRGLPGAHDQPVAADPRQPGPGPRPRRRRGRDARRACTDPGRAAA
ncbi:hypothetical protein [Nocardioides convexus]|uniref:hypothetical protein n=1 Tax=Nocardioides convexus TaxID=2712224 RepID=UPI0024188098|nr:hypothetical protein [Nocardioides convexus]